MTVTDFKPILILIILPGMKIVKIQTALQNTVCFFFIGLKVFVNLTYLYLLEASLIFSVGLGHLIIRSCK